MRRKCFEFYETIPLENYKTSFTIDDRAKKYKLLNILR